MTKEIKLDSIPLIRKHLSGLKKYPGKACYFVYLGQFRISIFTNAEYSIPSNIELKSVIDYKAVTVEIWENMGLVDEVTSDWYQSGRAYNMRALIDLSKDYRFTEFYKENEYPTPTDWMRKSGKLMPMEILFNLIKYTYRINELNAFH